MKDILNLGGVKIATRRIRKSRLYVGAKASKLHQFLRAKKETEKLASEFWDILGAMDSSDYIRQMPSETEFPDHAVVEINNTCNINCLMCNTAMAKRPKGVIEIELLEKILRELKAEGVRTVEVHTIGDPLANPRLPRILSVFRDVGMPLSLSTNGLLVERHVDTLIKYSDVVQHIRFSIDGATKETYEHIRAGGNWESLLHNLQVAKDRLIPIGYGFTSAMTLSRDNIHEAGLFVQLFRRFFDPRGMAFGFVNSLSPDTSYFHQVNLFPDDTFPHKPCQLPFQSFWVHIDGQVSSCCRDYHGEVIVGDVTTESIRKVWNGSALKRLREAHKQGDVSDYRLCDNCSIVDTRIGELFRAMMGYLVRKKPYAPAEYYQEKVDRFIDIIQSGKPYESEFSQSEIGIEIPRSG